MAVSTLQPDCGLKVPAEGDGPQAFSRPAAKVWLVTSEACPGGNHVCAGMPEEGMQELSWRNFFSDPTRWWDNRRSKKTPKHPDFRHKKSKNALWLNNWNKPAWVDSQLAMLDAQVDVHMQRPGSSRLAAHGVNLEVATCRKLCDDGRVTEAVDKLNLLVQRGFRLDTKLFYFVLKRCVAQKDLIVGRRIHALTVESGYECNAFLANHLICMYASHGQLVEAMQVFSKVPVPDAYMWASMILAHARHGQPSQAIGLYRQMLESTVMPDNHIFVAVLKACASAGDLAAGMDVHAHILASPGKPDVVVGTCLVDMYAKCGRLKDAQRVFDSLPQKDVVTWTAIIAGHAQRGMGEEALSLYSRMRQGGIIPPNPVTFVCLLQACASVGVGGLQQGKQLHAQIEEQGLQTDVVVGASLVTMYARCGSLDRARRVFDSLPQKDGVTWTAMIAGYAQLGMGQEALGLYGSMQQAGLPPPDSVTFTCLLQGCASVAALALGKQLHAQITERGLQDDFVLGNSLVHMYAKCGSLVDARQVFDSLLERDIVAWGAMIAGYGRQGDSEAVFNLVDRMKYEGIQPNGITFLGLLTVCSHVGLVDKGREYFAAMSTDHGITPSMEHYTCMMDLLGRAGHLNEALALVKSMPFQPTGAVWLTLLGACQKWSNVEMGRQVFEFAVRLDEKDAAAYVLMSNLYSGAQMLEEAKAMAGKEKKVQGMQAGRAELVHRRGWGGGS